MFFLIFVATRRWSGNCTGTVNGSTMVELRKGPDMLKRTGALGTFRYPTRGLKIEIEY
jgi:hypothetical protein